MVTIGSVINEKTAADAIRRGNLPSLVFKRLEYPNKMELYSYFAQNGGCAMHVPF